jgi:hypothetical protein
LIVHPILIAQLTKIRFQSNFCQGVDNLDSP